MIRRRKLSNGLRFIGRSLLHQPREKCDDHDVSDNNGHADILALKIGGRSSVDANIGSNGSHNFIIAVAMLMKTCASLRFQDNLSLGCCLLALWMHFWVSGALQGSILGVPRVQELHFGSLGAAFWMFWGHFGSSGGLLAAMVGSSWPRLATWEPTIEFLTVFSCHFGSHFG